MPVRMRQIGREMGAAVAVLALYMLVLLAPLHQSAGMQRQLALLGFESSQSWSVCTSLAAPGQGDSDAPTAAKCPLTGVGKTQFTALPPSPATVPPFFPRTVPLHYEADIGHAVLRRLEQPGRPRGPPVAA